MMNLVGVEVPVSILMMLKLVGERNDVPSDELWILVRMHEIEGWAYILSVWTNWQPDVTKRLPDGK